MSLDDFTANAQAMLAAAGKADTYLVTSVTRRGTATEYYLRASENSSLPWPVTVATASAGTAELALAGFAAMLQAAGPVLAEAATPVYAVVGSAEVLTPAITPTQASLIQYATASQKEEIIRLLNHPLITRQEKTKMLSSINRLDEERATQAIAKLRKAIEDREGTTAVAA
jgi:hypothetical protein